MGLAQRIQSLRKEGEGYATEAWTVRNRPEVAPLPLEQAFTCLEEVEMVLDTGEARGGAICEVLR